MRISIAISHGLQKIDYQIFNLFKLRNGTAFTDMGTDRKKSQKKTHHILTKPHKTDEQTKHCIIDSGKSVLNFFQEHKFKP